MCQSGSPRGSARSPGPTGNCQAGLKRKHRPLYFRLSSIRLVSLTLVSPIHLPRSRTVSPRTANAEAGLEVVPHPLFIPL